MSNIEELLDDQGYWDSIEQCKIAEYINQLHSQIKELEAENAVLIAEVDHIERTKAEWRNTAYQLDVQLAASQLREQQLLEALSSAEYALDECRDYPLTYSDVIEALTLPPDTTALETMIAKSGEVIVNKAKQACIDLGAKGIDYFNYTSFVEAIDNLPTVTLEDLK